jgi:hypothetical protein
MLLLGRGLRMCIPGREDLSTEKDKANELATAKTSQGATNVHLKDLPGLRTLAAERDGQRADPHSMQCDTKRASTIQLG